MIKKLALTLLLLVALTLPSVAKGDADATIHLFDESHLQQIEKLVGKDYHIIKIIKRDKHDLYMVRTQQYSITYMIPIINKETQNNGK